MRVPKGEIDQARLLLRSRGWLSGCPEHFRDAVLSEGQWLRVAPEQPVARGGESGGMFGLATGCVGIIPAVAAPDAGLIHIARAPFWFGLQPFLTGEGRRVTALARGDCLVAHLSQVSLTRILARYPEGWRMLLDLLNALTTTAIQGASDLLLADRRRRCAAVLLRLAGARNAGTQAHDVLCSHEELAAMCNLSRSALSIMLKRFEAERMITLGYRCIRLHDADRLRRVVDHC